MGYGLTLTTPPGREPVTTEELKKHLRLETSDDNDVVDGLGMAARDLVETWTGRQLLTATWTLTLDLFKRGEHARTNEHGNHFPLFFWIGWFPADWLAIKIPKPPTQSVSQVQYTAPDGSTQVLDPSLYQVDTTREPARLAPSYGNIWPIPRPQMA